MAVTRSGRAVGKTSKKFKFTEDGEAPSDTEIVSVNSSRAGTEEPEQTGAASSGSDSDEDSDEAPEEESVSQSKSAAIERKKEQAKLEQELRQQEREKRKQRDLHYKQQQEAKREKIRELAAGDILPELLPEEVLESDDEESKIPKSHSGKHLRAEHFEEEDAAERKRMKIEKLKRLKEMRTQALKKGPVYVQVQQNTSSKTRVPQAEQSILQSKTSWFQRESLHRK